MPDPIVATQNIQAEGDSFGIFEWKGSGPDYVHVHYKDDEAWHVLEGTLTFNLNGETVTATKGATVFVPAGVKHSYQADENAKYLIILTPRLTALIKELHQTPYAQHGEVMQKYESGIVTL